MHFALSFIILDHSSALPNYLIQSKTNPLTYIGKAGNVLIYDYYLIISSKSHI